jgi:hypothetical protein
VQRVEVVDEGEEEQEEVVVQGGPRPLTLPDVD